MVEEERMMEGVGWGRSDEGVGRVEEEGAAAEEPGNGLTQS